MSSDDQPATTILGDVEGDTPGVPALLSAESGGKVIQLRQGTNLIGRGESAFVRLDRTGVSRRHAAVVVEGERVSIRDLGSTNGTFVRDERIEEADLADGDLIRFGSQAELRYLIWRGASTGVPEGVHLTKRELQIARLVARGLGNEEVGNELGISRRTVSTHLSRIYPRLGVTSRTELARLLTDWGLS